MLSTLESAGKKQKTVHVLADQQLWLIELRDKNPSLKHLRLAQEIQDNVGGDLICCPAQLLVIGLNQTLLRESTRWTRLGHMPHALDAPNSLFQLFQRCKGTNTALSCLNGTCKYVFLSCFGC